MTLNKVDLEMSTCAVVVNYGHAELTIQAVDALLKQSVAPAKIFVVDNASPDNSVEKLENAISGLQSVHMIQAPVNLGFGGGCNLALRIAVEEEFKVAWLLNNDAAPDANCLETLLDRFSEGKAGSLGAVGSMLTSPADNAPPHYGSAFNPRTLASRPLSEPNELDDCATSWITAASMLVSLEALKVVGLFDEEFFMYWEDADLCMRLRAANQRLVVAPGASVRHSAGTSSDHIPSMRYVWHLESLMRWHSKHLPNQRFRRAIIPAKFCLKAVLDRDLERLRAILGFLRNS